MTTDAIEWIDECSHGLRTTRKEFVLTVLMNAYSQEEERKVNVTFTDVPAASRRIMLDLTNRIAELFDLNNAAALPPHE